MEMALEELNHGDARQTLCKLCATPCILLLYSFANSRTSNPSHLNYLKITGGLSPFPKTFSGGANPVARYVSLMHLKSCEAVSGLPNSKLYHKKQPAVNLLDTRVGRVALLDLLCTGLIESSMNVFLLMSVRLGSSS